MLKNIVSLIVLLTAAVSLAKTSNSIKYSAFDTDSQERRTFIFSQNARVNARLAKSASREKLEPMLKTRLEGEKNIKSTTLPSGDRIKAIDKGLNLEQQIVLIPKEGEQQVLFTTNDIKQNNQYRISNFQLNPGLNKMAILIFANASKDDSYLYVLDMTTKKLILKHVLFAGRRVLWANDDVMLYRDITPEGTIQIKSMKLNGEAPPEVSVVISNYDIEGTTSNSFILGSTERDHFVILTRGEPALELTGLRGTTFEGRFEDKFYFSRRSFQNGVNLTELYSLTKEKPELLFERSFPGNLVSTYLGETFFAYVDQNGFQKTVYYHDFKNEKVSRLNIPDYITVDSISETDNEGELELELSSDLDSKTVTWKTSANDLVFDDNFKKEMLESENLSLEVKFITVKSFDGTPISVHIVYNKAITPSKSPVLMEVYGGFDSSGYMDPTVNMQNLSFIKRGGVYVGPGVRGGNEYGEGWHQSAMKEKKIKTYEDVASVAKYLIDSGISEKSKIAIAGTSNGGLTVAATGLLFPQYFGLVIATNGVLDLLSKQMLDKRYDGWADEYGDPRDADAAEYLAGISPLENVDKAENGPAFLIMNGRKDTRVNPAHSIKFAKAAEDLRASGKNVNVELISLNNVGHGMIAPDNDYIALRARLIFWSRIYDDFGMTY